MIFPLLDAVKKNKAVYKYNKDKKPDNYDNFADYQLRHIEWLPCRPSLFHSGLTVSPCKAFLPQKGLQLFPEVIKENVGDEEWYSRIVNKLRELGVRDKLPEDPQEWHQWMRDLPEKARMLCEDEQNAKERSEKSGLLWNAADALYRRYLKLDIENEEFPKQIDVPCVTWANDCETLSFAPPGKVYYVDEPHFDEVRQEIIRKGYKLFIVSLNAGKNASKRLGVRPLTDQLCAKPHYGAVVKEKSEKFVARYKERRVALTLAAELRKPLPETLDIKAVRGLRLQLSAMESKVADVDVLSWRTENGQLLINLDKDPWRALANGLAARIAGAANKGPLFENLLRADGMDEVLDRLREQGLTEEDIQEVATSLISLEPSTEPPTPPPPTEPQTEPQTNPPSTEPQAKSPTEPQAGPPTEPRKKRPTSPVPQRSRPAGQRHQPDTESTTPPARPHPEKGFKAEDWLAEKLEKEFPGCVRQQVKDEKGGIIDFVLSIATNQVHIEVKRAENKPGTIFWSDLQYEKAQELEGVSEKYFIAVLFPNTDQSYDIYWIWNPLDELRAALRDVQWAGQSDYQPVDGDTWDVDDKRPSQVPTKHYKFRIRLTLEIIEELAQDSMALEVLKRQVGAA